MESLPASLCLAVDALIAVLRDVWKIPADYKVSIHGDYIEIPSRLSGKFGVYEINIMEPGGRSGEAYFRSDNEHFAFVAAAEDFLQMHAAHAGTEEASEREIAEGILRYHASLPSNETMQRILSYLYVCSTKEPQVSTAELLDRPILNFEPQKPAQWIGIKLSDLPAFRRVLVDMDVDEKAAASNPPALPSSDNATPPYTSEDEENDDEEND